MSNMVVRTNTLALNSHRNLGNVGNMQARSSARLSSGFRINSAADDAAGLGISENMRAQIRGLDQASRNAQDGISLIQTAEGALSTVNEMVTRIRELVVQSGNDTNTDADRGRIQNEIDQLKSEISEVSQRTEFNTRTLLSGALDGTMSNIVANEIGADGVNDAATAEQFVRFIEAIGQLNEVTGWNIHAAPADAAEAAAVVAVVNSLQALMTSGTISDLEQLRDDIAAAGGTTDIIADAGLVVPPTDAAEAQAIADFISEVQGFASQMEDGGNEFTFQIGANAHQQITVSIDNMDWDSISNNLQIDLVDSGSDVGALLDSLDETLGVVTAQRSELGAVQNRLEFTIQNLDISSENLSAANSRIRDADMAKEMMRLTQANVLQQAATSMLAQGNQSPQSILQLLG